MVRSDILQSTPEPSLCPVTVPASCITVPASTLDWQVHGQHQYQAVIRVETLAGHIVDTVSTTYQHSYGPPVAGRVWEADLNSSKVNIYQNYIIVSPINILICYITFLPVPNKICNVTSHLKFPLCPFIREKQILTFK